MRIFVFLIMLFLPLANAIGYERITNVYEAVVPLADRSDAVRNQAIKKGLEQVLVRYTGYTSVASIVEVARELNSAQRYVIEYGVETIELESADGLGKEEGDALWVRFNANLIDQLANQLELPIWPTLRPTLSYVVVMELWGKPHIPTAEQYPALSLHLDRIFNERGLAVSQLSTVQLASIQADDLWNMDQITADILQAQSNTDVTLIVRLHDYENNHQEIDFLFLEKDAETVIHKTADSLIAGLDAGINQFVDQLSSDLAFLGGDNVELDLYIQILGMRSYAEYKTVLNQIAGLEQVISARMENATDEGIGYLIRYQSDQTLLIESITEITGIQQVPAIASEQATDVSIGSVGSPIYFRYPNSTFNPAMPFIQKELSKQRQEQQGLPRVIGTEPAISGNQG